MYNVKLKKIDHAKHITYKYHIASKIYNILYKI